MNKTNYEDCIRACLLCAAVCDHCASACLHEAHPEKMIKCIQLDMECSAICYTSARLMSYDSTRARELCRICAAACEDCAAECKKHDHDHCRRCAEICLECAAECKKMAA